MKRVAIVAVLCWAASANAQTAPSVNVEQYTLSNGLQVVLAPDPSVTSVVVHVGFHVGSKDEVAGKTGFSHLFEHLMFAGSTHVDDGEFDRLLEGAGGWNNGSTTADRTNFYEQLPSNQLALALWLEADRLAGLWDAINQAALDNQRDVVKNERRESYENRPYGLAELDVQQALWPDDHGNHNLTIGTEADLDGAKLEDVHAFWTTYYVPSNATLVIAGAFDVAKTRALIERDFGWMPNKPAPKTRAMQAPVTPRDRSVELTTTDAVQASKVIIAWRGDGPMSATSTDLTLIAQILGGGATSRLYRRLVMHDRVATQVAAEYEPQILGGEFQVHAIARVGVDPAALRAAIADELDQLRRHPPSDDELARARQVEKAEITRGLESLVSRAERLSDWMRLLGKPDGAGEEFAAFDRATPKSISATAAHWLTATSFVAMTVSPLLTQPTGPAKEVADKPAPINVAPPTHNVNVPWPSKGIDWSKPPKAAAEPHFIAPVPKEFSLANGVHVVLIENHRLPLVSIHVVAEAAGSREDGAHHGIAALTSNVLDEAAGAYTHDTLPEALERLGADLSTSVTADASVVELDSLRDALPGAVALLGDVLARPTFSDDDIARIKSDKLAALALRRDDPNQVASMVFQHAIFDAHPYGPPADGDIASVSAISADDIRAWWRNHYGPASTTIVIAGDVDVATIKPMLASALESWRNTTAPLPAIAIAPSTPTPPRLFLVDRPGAAQAVIIIGRRGPNAADADHAAGELLNVAVGGSFGSRLNLSLRENLGYTYNIESGFWRGLNGGSWSIESAMQTINAVDGIRECLHIVDDVRRHGLHRDELAQATQSMIRKAPQAFETNGGIVGEFGWLVEAHRPLNYFVDWQKRIRSITAAQVHTLAERLWSKLTIVVVGDAKVIEPGLAKFGIQIERVIADGPDGAISAVVPELAPHKPHVIHHDKSHSP